MPAGSLLGALAAPRPRGLLRPEPSSRAGGFYPRGSCRCSVDNQQKRHGHSIAPLDEAAALRPNSGHARIWTTANTRRATANDTLGVAVVRALPASLAVGLRCRRHLVGPARLQ